MPLIKTRCGYIAIVGRPNVGKSTLLNHLLGQKICITSRKPQTTRHAIVGVKTHEHAQLVFVDTPGQHLGEKKAINRTMNRAATRAMDGVDIALFVVDRQRWTEEDQLVKKRLDDLHIPVIVVVNKIDRIADKATLVPQLKKLQEMLPDAKIFPTSALKGNNLEQLENLMISLLPHGAFIYPEDQITDRSMRFIASEIVREKIIRQLGEEVPYATAVEIERWEQDGDLTRIHALIHVERDGQKSILIGSKGERLKSIGTAARIDMENMIGNKVMLQLWVKVKSGWADDERALRSLGYQE